MSRTCLGRVPSAAHSVRSTLTSMTDSVVWSTRERDRWRLWSRLASFQWSPHALRRLSASGISHHRRRHDGWHGGTTGCPGLSSRQRTVTSCLSTRTTVYAGATTAFRRIGARPRSMRTLMNSVNSPGVPKASSRTTTPIAQRQWSVRRSCGWPTLPTSYRSNRWLPCEPHEEPIGCSWCFPLRRIDPTWRPT